MPGDLNLQKRHWQLGFLQVCSTYDLEAIGKTTGVHSVDHVDVTGKQET